MVVQILIPVYLAPRVVSTSTTWSVLQKFGSIVHHSSRVPLVPLILGGKLGFSIRLLFGRISYMMGLKHFERRLLDSTFSHWQNLVINETFDLGIFLPRFVHCSHRRFQFRKRDACSKRDRMKQNFAQNGRLELPCALVPVCRRCLLNAQTDDRWKHDVPIATRQWSSTFIVLLRLVNSASKEAIRLWMSCCSYIPLPRKQISC